MIIGIATGYLPMVWVLSVTRRNSVGQGVMGGLGCSLLQMLTMTRFGSSHWLVKDRFRCFAFSDYLCFDVLMASFNLVKSESDWGNQVHLLWWHKVTVDIKCNLSLIGETVKETLENIKFDSKPVLEYEQCQNPTCMMRSNWMLSWAVG